MFGARARLRITAATACWPSGDSPRPSPHTVRTVKPIRKDLRARGAVLEIPTKRNRHVQHSVSRPLYALSSGIECFINRFKNSRRVATRYDQTADSFLGFAALSSIRLWIRFVHAT